MCPDVKYVGDVSGMSATCRECRFLADIIFYYVGNMSANMSPTIGDMSLCRRF
jgi:hypothetical protein